MAEKTITLDVDKVLDHKISVSILRNFHSILTIVLIFLTACGFMITLLWNIKEEMSYMREDFDHSLAQLREELKAEINSVSYRPLDIRAMSADPETKE